MLVSICIALHNSAKYIRNTLQSVQNQTYRDFECILVDDYSTDDTVNIVYEEFCKKDKRFKLFVNITDPNKPYVDAHNLSYILAKGEYLFRMDHDDEMFPDCVEFQVKFLEEHPDIDGACVNMIRVKENDDYSLNKELDVTHTIKDPKERKLKAEAATKECCDLFNKFNAYTFKTNLMCWYNQASCIRKSFFNTVHPRYEIFRTGDYIFWWRVLAGGAKLYKHVEPKMYYRESDDTLCRQNDFKITPAEDCDYQILIAKYKARAFKIRGNEVYPDGSDSYGVYRVFDNTVKYYEMLKSERNE